MLSGLAMLVAFQNCTVPMTPADRSSTAEADKLDFAYDAKINQIAYMTCSNLTGDQYDKSAYFSIRAGAYDNNRLFGLMADNGGLRLKDSFFAALARKQPEKQISLLSLSKANTATTMQLAVRPTSNYQGVLTSTGAARQGLDFQNLLDVLGTTGVSRELVNLPDNERLRYIRNELMGGRMEGSLMFASNAEGVLTLRNGLSSVESLLALTFTERSGTSAIDYAARSPSHVIEGSAANPARTVYGRGYELGFETIGAGSLNGTHYQTAVLAAVSERNLENPSDRQGDWACPQMLRFKIILDEDINDPDSICRKRPDPLDSEMSAELRIARNSLRHEDWWIDMENRCIISKKTASAGCYGNRRYIQYNPNIRCNHSPTTNNSVETNKLCAAYASICVRRN
jgi:hypothetical protein